MRQWRLIAAILAACGSIPILEASAIAADSAFEIVRDHVDYDVSTDGSYVEKQEKIFRILSPQGLDALHEVVLSYTDDYQDATIDSAYTLKRDGRRIDVPKDKMFVGYGLTTAPGFHDQKTKVAIFENAEVGDEVGYVTEFRQKKPWYPGRFFTSFSLGQNTPLHDFRVTVSAPPSLALHVDANGLTGGRVADAGPAQRWSWSFDGGTTQAPEDDSVTGFDNGAYLVVSTFEGFAALARSYEDGARGNAEPTAEVRALADRLTTGTRDRREIVHKLYDWVSSNIKYVAIVLGNGGLVPHAAADVLRSGYGDCKDHVTLLEALLTAKGIPSSPVLIDLGPSYHLPSAASPELFNHLITYVPEFDLYLDSTAKYVPFGDLPTDDMDKPVLRIASGTVSRTPTETAEHATLHTVSDVQIHADGSADGDSHFTATGPLAADMRSTLGRVGPGMDSAYLRASVPGTVAGSLIQAQPPNQSGAFSGSARYRIENAASFPGPGAISFGLGYRPKSLQDLIDAHFPQRHANYICSSFVDTDETIVQLPSDVHITSVPRSAQASAGGVTLHTTYARIAYNAVKATVTLRAEHPHMVCAADDYNRVRDELSRMIGLLGAQVVYEPAAVAETARNAKLVYAPCAARKCSSQ
jgi:hypothetical protein